MITLFFIYCLTVARCWAGGGGGFLGPFLAQQKPVDPCYGQSDKGAKKCVPDFVNAAFEKNVIVSSTCGPPPQEYCYTSGNSDNRTCSVCDDSDPKLRHPAGFLTDNHNFNNITCWQSEPLLSQEDNVTLSVSFNKKYELRYVSVEFCSVKPDSMALYKSMDYGKSWQPFQYYSSQCRKMYNRPTRAEITKANEQEPLCFDVGTNQEPLPGSRIAFSTLDSRPSAFDFDNSPVLQDWVTATDIKLVINRVDPGIPENHTKFYSISDLSIGGRCKCNGHASRCIEDRDGKLMCECKHNTAGRDCEKCKAFHFDRPWGRASPRSAHECKGKYKKLL